MVQVRASPGAAWLPLRLPAVPTQVWPAAQPCSAHQLARKSPVQMRPSPTPRLCVLSANCKTSSPTDMPPRNQANTPTFVVDLRQQRSFLLRSKDPPPSRRLQHIYIGHNVPSSGLQREVSGVNKDQAQPPAPLHGRDRTLTAMPPARPSTCPSRSRWWSPRTARTSAGAPGAAHRAEPPSPRMSARRRNMAGGSPRPRSIYCISNCCPNIAWPKRWRICSACTWQAPRLPT